MKSLNSFSSMPSLVATDPVTSLEPPRNLNPNLLLEISKTAQLLSNQLLNLHQQVVKSSSSDFNMTPISSGYSSTCTSANASITKSYCKTSSTLSLLNSTLEESESSASAIKRRLFESDLSTSLLNASSTSTKKAKSNSNLLISSNNLKTPDSKQKVEYKTPNHRKTPVIPRIKDWRKSVRNLTNYHRFKMRRALNNNHDNDF